MSPRLPPFDFQPALRLPLGERLSVSVARVIEWHRRSGYAELCNDLPPVPQAGTSVVEIAALEEQLGISLPAEYRAFLCRWRYLDLGTGMKIWGFDHEGVSIGSPWVSEEHPVQGRFLVFGDYWRFADGDQLMFDLSNPEAPVVAYLHEERPPRIEPFAPSFSLALWRMVHEES